MGLSRWLAVGLVTVLVQDARAQGKGHLETVLAQMDAASAKFRSAEADFQWDLFERVVRSTSTKSGKIFFERQKRGSTEMGAKIVQPAVTFLSYEGGVLEVFDPVQNTLIKMAAKQNQGQYESFLTLGFGGSGTDLQKLWTITDQGQEAVDGVPCAKLDLVSKDAGVRNMFSHVTIWVDTTRDVSLKQEFSTPSDDKRTAFYKNIRVNEKVDQKVYDIKPNGKTQVTNR